MVDVASQRATTLACWRVRREDQVKILLPIRSLSLNLFANSDCGALCIFEKDNLIHYSAFSPRYWRFPFLRDTDLQIGNTWTEPSCRGRGLAFFALVQIIEEMDEIGRDFWYVVDRENLPSISVAEKAGFKCIATGDWIKPWGIKLLGAYTIRTNQSEKQDPTPADISDPNGPFTKAADRSRHYPH